MRGFLRQIFGGDSDTVAPVDAANAIRKAITVTGRVQGVGFRFFVKQEAHALKITGWVMNLNDGSVTMEVQSTPEVLNELIARLKKGNGVSKVVQLREKDLPVVAGENKFAIRY